jgi:hypothetical protein
MSQVLKNFLIVSPGTIAKVFGAHHFGADP